MIKDPCSLVPDLHIPGGLPLRPVRAVHHVVGRIRHRVVHLRRPNVSPPDNGINGCEKHAFNLSKAQDPGIHIATLPKILLLGGASVTIGALGGMLVVFLRSEGGNAPGLGGKIHVPEPSSVALYVFALLAVVISRRLRTRPAQYQVSLSGTCRSTKKGKQFFFKKKNQKTFVYSILAVG